ncbi:uncharacterized protein BDV14DRAFT_198851 [Aspergillus stella-maris]|uniref:uncharacterized protein n=1 Tax=Aspergillus stella-maris TaxID=1810926 RepID=UPI003CCE32AC
MPSLSISSRPPTDELDLFMSDPETENEFEYRSIPSRLYTIFEEISESETENKNGTRMMDLEHGRAEERMDADVDAEAQSSADKSPRGENEEMDLDGQNEDMVGDEDREFDLAMILAGARIGDAWVYRVPMVETDDESEGEDEGETSPSDRAMAQALEHGQVMAGILRAGEATERFDEYDADEEDVEG